MKVGSDCRSKSAEWPKVEPPKCKPELKFETFENSNLPKIVCSSFYFILQRRMIGKNVRY